MPAQSYSTVWNGYLSGTTGTVNVGDCVIPDADAEFYIVATAANRTAASRTARVSGIALTAGDDDNRHIEFQTIGPCPPSITGLTAGTASDLRVSSTGRLERATISGSDIYAGRCDADGWAYLDFAGSASAVAASATAGGDNKTIQYNSSGSFGGETQWTRESDGRLNGKYAVMSDDPNLTFTASSKTIVRSSGSWVTDGVVVGPTYHVRGTTSNNKTITPTIVTASTLTISESLTDESTSGDNSVEGGSYWSVGLVGASYPAYGAVRVAVPVDQYSDITLIAGRSAVDDHTYPLISVAWLGDIGVGGTWRESSLNAGVLLKIRKLGIWSEQLHDFSDSRDWTFDRGATIPFQQERRSVVTTTNATPTSLGLTLPESLSSLGPVTVFITADKAASSDYGIWIYSAGVLVYEDKASGASTWSATTSTVTGQASSTITWTAYAVSPLYIPLASTDPGINGLRLTLTTAVPVTTSDVTGATTIYFTPHTSGAISLYTGSAWVQRTTAEVSIALGTLSSGKNYDVFAYWTGSAVALEFSAAWSSDTARTDAITRQNGVWVKSGATTKRLVGTFRTTSTTQTEDSASKRFLWNGPERWRQDRRTLLVIEATNTWNWTTATWQQANASGANQVSYVTGMADSEVEADVHGIYINNNDANASVGVGVDSATANSAQRMGSNNAGQTTAEYNGFPGLGYHYLAWLEISEASGTTTWSGDNNVTYTQSGLRARVWA